MVLAGNIVRASDAYTTWTTFTPTWLNITVGNGSVGGRYRRVGSFTIEFRAQILFGSTTSVTGTIGLTVPGGLSGEGASTRQIIQAGAFDNSGPTGIPAIGLLQSGGGTQIDRFYGAVSNFWTSTVPWTWATSDQIWCKASLEVTT
jgi:hypothetical protein